MTRSRRARFAQPGPLALHPEAWGLDFLFFGPPEDVAPFEMCGPAAVAVVDIGRGGPLVQHEDWCWDSYESIQARAAAAFASEATAVVLRVDSPGGDVAGCFDLARELRALSASTGKPLYAFTAGTCASAAYALASAAKEVVSSDTANVGSVGVMGISFDQTALDAAMGVKVTVFTSGERKVDGNPHVALDDAAHANLQGRILTLAAIFFELVAEHRQLDAGDVKALLGNVFVGADAVRVGLVDRVATWGELIAGLSGTETSMLTKASKYDEAVGAMKRAAEGDDDDAKKAKKALKAIEDGDKPADDKKDDDKSKAADEETKKDEEAKAAASKAEDEKKKDEEAKALASGTNLALAREVQELKAKDAARDLADANAKAAQAKAALLAKRPDFSPAVRATLEAGPLATLEDAVKNWPRVMAAPGSSVNAITPDVAGGEAVPAGYQPKLSAEEQEVLAKLDAKSPVAKTAVQRGTDLIMPADITQAAAKARAEALELQMKEVV